jgi:K+-transporting ATPase KdpF subunit
MIIYLPYKTNTMKTRVLVSFLPLAAVPVNPGESASNGPLSYIAGGIIALLILAYLIYTLLHPEKF